MRVSTGQMFAQGLRAITDGQRELASTQVRIATGKRIATPSDDPAAAGKIVKLEEAIALGRQYRASAESASSRLALEDTTLDAFTNVLHRVRELALQANNDTLTSADRQGIGREVALAREQLVGLANARDGNGEHLFAGYATGTAPFATDGAGDVVYQGDAGRREVQVGPGVRIASGDPGTRVFVAIANGNGTFRTADDPANAGAGVIGAGTVVDRAAWVPDDYTITFVTAASYEVRDGGGGLVASGAHQGGSAIAFNGISVEVAGAPAAGDRFTVAPSAGQDVFATVRALADALADPDSDAAGNARLHNAVNRSLADLDQALERVRDTRTTVGARLEAIEGETRALEDAELRLRSDVSRLEDADLAALITELNLQLTSLQAANQSFARLQNLSLFSFL